MAAAASAARAAPMHACFMRAWLPVVGVLGTPLVLDGDVAEFVG